MAWSPDGTKIASGSDDRTVKVWNAQTGQCVSTWAHRYTLFLCFGISDFPKSTPKPGVLFSSDWGGSEYSSVNDLTASEVAGH